jgi:hypothetical protein
MQLPAIDPAEIDGIKERDPKDGAEKDRTAVHEPGIKGPASVGSESPSREPIHHPQTRSASIAADYAGVLAKMVGSRDDPGFSIGAHCKPNVHGVPESLRVFNERRLRRANRTQISCLVSRTEAVPFPATRPFLP